MFFINILKFVFFRRRRATVVVKPAKFANLVSCPSATTGHNFMGRQTPGIYTRLYITVLYNNRRKDGLKCDWPVLSSH